MHKGKNSLKRVCVFPGSFTTFHVGHKHVLERAVTLFDEVIVLVLINGNKNNKDTLKQRYIKTKEIIKMMNNECIKVDKFDGLTTTYMKEINCKHMIRGIRNDSDFHYEQRLANQYFEQDSSIDIIYFLNRL